MSFGKRVRRLRGQKGLTQQQLADRVGVPQPTIARLETGVHHGPRLEVAKGIAKALGVTLDYLAGMYDEEKEDEEPAPAVAALAGRQ